MPPTKDAHHVGPMGTDFGTPDAVDRRRHADQHEYAEQVDEPEAAEYAWPHLRRHREGDNRREENQDGVEGLLRRGGVVPVGGGQMLEAALAAHDGDRRVGQAGQVARQVADVRPAAVLVVGEVAHVVEPVPDVPVAPDELPDPLGAGRAGPSEVSP